MTDMLPYNTKQREIAITAAIRDMELPANISLLLVPKVVCDSLQACWHRKPGLRPNIKSCASMLSSIWSSSSFMSLPLEAVGSDFEVQADGWYPVSNPARRHEIDLPEAGSPEYMRYAVIAVRPAILAGYWPWLLISTALHSASEHDSSTIRKWSFSSDGKEIVTVNGTIISFYELETAHRRR